MSLGEDVVRGVGGAKANELWFKQQGKLEEQRAREAAHAALSVAPGEGAIYTDDGSGTLTLVKPSETTFIPGPLGLNPEFVRPPMPINRRTGAAIRTVAPSRTALVGPLFPSGGGTIIPGGGFNPYAPGLPPGLGGPTVVTGPGSYPGLGNRYGGVNPLVPGGTVPGTGGSNPIIDTGCSFLPDFLQAACRQVGNQITSGGGGQVVPAPGDPTPISTTPAERSVGGAGLMAPMASSVTRLQCPTFPDGKTGILWMLPLTGDIVCLPRQVSGKPWGLVRKNKPRKKPPFTRAEWKAITGRVSKSDKKKARELAKATGINPRK